MARLRRTDAVYVIQGAPRRLLGEHVAAGLQGCHHEVSGHGIGRAHEDGVEITTQELLCIGEEGAIRLTAYRRTRRVGHGR